MDKPESSKANLLFTDGFRLALAQAVMVARKLGHERLAPEHIALGVLAVDADRDIQNLLSALGIEPARLDGALRNTLELGESQTIRGELPYHPEAKALLQRAMILSVDHAHPSVGGDHLFAALTESTREPMRTTFHQYDITPVRVVHELVKCRRK